MKLLFQFVLLNCICASLLVAQNTKETEDYIRKSESEWAESVASGDSSVLERILANDFVGVDTKGNVYDKAKMITDTNEAPKYFVSNHLEQVNIRFYGNTAVAQGSEAWVRKNGDKGRFVWIDTWLLRDGKWQIAAAVDVKAPAK